MRKLSSLCEYLGIVILITFLIAPQEVRSTEITGTPEELKQFLRSEVRTVSLHNNATETAYTDIAKITLIVVTSDRKLSSAIEQNTRVREELYGNLVASSIPAESIRSSKYSASPQYRWFGKTPSSFEVVNSVVVEVDSESQFLGVSSLADSNEAISFGGVTFELDDEEALEEQVREKALQAVLSDAAYFEGRLGLKLQPVAFTYSPVNRASYDRNSLIEEIIVTANRIGSAALEPELPDNTFDEVQLSVSVQVTFEVIPQE